MYSVGISGKGQNGIKPDKEVISGNVGPTTYVQGFAGLQAAAIDLRALCDASNAGSPINSLTNELIGFMQRTQAEIIISIMPWETWALDIRVCT